MRRNEAASRASRNAPLPPIDAAGASLAQIRSAMPPPSAAAAEPPSRLRRSLERLPNELLQPIADGLVPAAPLTTRFALRPAGTWEFRDARHQWADWLVAHASLLAFAQTSRRMADVAKPRLYHTLVIPTPRTLVTLFRRIHARPEIRPWIRSITCIANVAGVLTIDATLREWERQTGGKPSSPGPLPPSPSFGRARAAAAEHAC